MTGLRRRAWLGVLTAMCLCSAVRPEVLPARTAEFAEVGDRVLVTLALPELVPRRDRDAVKAIDSGFATTLIFDITLHRHGISGVVTRTRRVARIAYNLWNEHYEVETTDEGAGTARRYFRDREQAIRAAVTLRSFPVARASALGRGSSGPYYFAAIRALRNPISPDSWNESASERVRGQGRDIRWFAELVDLLVEAHPLAEDIVEVRTNYFYLVPR